MLIEQIVLNWNIQVIPVPIYHTAWDINQEYVLKVYHNITELKRNIVMMKTLYDANIPVPKIIALPDGADYYEEDESYYLLTTKLHGSNLVDLNYRNEEWFYQFGGILAQLHLAFQKCEAKVSFWNNSMLEEMKGWVSTNINKFCPEWLKLEDVTDTIGEFENLYTDLPKQLIHRDVHLGNFLFHEGEFTGYIDFDLSQSNIRIFDLCYFLLGILLKEDNNRVDEKQWYRVVTQVIKGYNSKISMLIIELRAIPSVMKNIELLFVAYFLGQGDEKLAKEAADLFYFVKNNEPKIVIAIEELRYIS